jgi:hypothetical protein
VEYCSKKYGNFLMTCALMVVLMCQAGLVKAQVVDDASVADLDDFRTSFMNPASLSYLPNQLIFGSKAYEVGVNSSFFDMSNGYVSYYSPYWRKRLGVSGQFLRTGLFDLTDFAFSYSERVHQLFSVGGRLDIINQGFNESSFQGVDPGDPVLSNGLSKNYFSFTVGFMVVPVPELSLGAVFENINRPNVALLTDDSFLLPVICDFGAQYRMDKFRPSVGFRYEDGVARYNLRLGVKLREDLLFRFDYRKEKVGFEGHVQLYRGLNLNYRYQYPLNELSTFSSGSHNIAFVYDFTRIINLPGLMNINYEPEPVTLIRSTRNIPVGGDFSVLSSTNSLEIWEKNITRRADEDIPIEFLKRNYEKIFEEPDGEAPVDSGMAAFYPDTLNELVGTYSDDYKESLDSLSTILGKEGIEARIYTREGDLLRAENIKEFISSKSKIPPERIQILRAHDGSSDPGVTDSLTVGADTIEIPVDTAAVEIAGVDSGAQDEFDLSMIGRTERRIVLSEDNIEFRIFSIGKDDYSSPWSLEIRDEAGGLIRSFTGRGAVPRSIWWDWRDESGSLIEPAWYTYVFRWEDTGGGSIETPMGRIYVKKNKKDILIELTRKRSVRDLDAQRIELLLDQ